MATLTGTACASGVQPRGVTPGNWTVSFAYKNSDRGQVTISAGDVILLGKIPHGATIVDGYVIQSGGDTGSISVGIDDAVDDLVASQSTSDGALIRLDHGIPYTVSVSDDATIRYHVVKIGVDADYSTTTVFRVVLNCTYDP